MAPPLVLVVIAWVLGLLIAEAWLVPYGIRPLPVALLCLLPIGALLLWWKDKTLRIGGFCALTLLLGTLRYQIAQPSLSSPQNVATYNDSGWVTAEGVISAYPDRRDKSTLLQIEVDTLEIRDTVQNAHGAVLVQTARFPEYEYGDRIRISGLLETPPELEGFSYREYLARRGIFSLIKRPKIELLSTGQGSRFWASLYRTKDRLRLAVARLMPAPESALMQGILLGIRSEIPGEIYDEFNTTSTSHILVISGANVVIVTALLAATLGRVLGRRRGYWATMAGLAGYVLLVGADAPVVRAGLMAGMVLTGRHLGRGTTSYVSLCAAVLALTVADPWSLWDTSFQLSFLAAAGLIFLSGPLERLMDRCLWQRVAGTRSRALLRQTGEAIAVTFAPQMMVLPLIAASFQRLSLASPLANILIAPAQPLIMTWGCLATLVGLSHWLLPLARVVAWVPWVLLAYTRAVVHWMSGWPYASLPVSRATSSWLALGIYGGLVLLVLVRSKTAWQSRAASLAGSRPRRFGLVVALLAVILLSFTIGQLPDHRLHVQFLDVGQGDAILITTPRGQQILVDGGPSAGALLPGLGRAMPFWDRSIDAVVSTHADADHITGLVAVLERYEVGVWIDNGMDEGEPLAEECLRRLSQAGVERRVARAGDRFDLGDGILLDAINPSSSGWASGVLGVSSNNSSVVLFLRHGSNSFLLTGDIESEAETALVHGTHELQADVLKVAHHGSAKSSTQEFLDAVDPSFAVISVGADNRSGHPAPETLGRLAGARDLLVYRTDLKGTIEFVSDGQQLWVHTQHE